MTRDELLALYGTVSVRARDKVHGSLDEHDRRFIALSPFCVLATIGDLPDVTPRGDVPGFVKVLEDGRLVLPDRPGNNRLDSLLNVVADPRVGLIFLVPGLGETLRVNGTAQISVDPHLLALGAHKDKPPLSVLVVTPAEVLFQCPRALTRSALWDPALHVDPHGLPTLDDVLADQVEELTLERSRELGRAGVVKPLW